MRWMSTYLEELRVRDLVLRVKVEDVQVVDVVLSKELKDDAAGR